MPTETAKVEAYILYARERGLNLTEQDIAYLCGFIDNLIKLTIADYEKRYAQNK